MTKEDIYVVVDTPKNAKKLKKVLEMFGEKLNIVDKLAIKKGSYKGSANLYTEYNTSYFDGATWALMPESAIEYKTKVSIKQLRNILAKEHLKVGDYVVSDNNFICRIDKIEDDGIHFSNPFFGVYDISYFKRYATPEEIELLEGKKELEVGKWYKHPNNKYPNWLVYYGGNKKCYGFRTSGIWDDDSKNEWFEYLNAYPMVEATAEEVKSALIKEAKKRYNVGDKVKSLYSDSYVGNLNFKYVKYYHNDNSLWISSEYLNIQVFKNGKWAEIIKSDDKPKVGDVCKFWDDDEDEFIIDTLLSIEEIDKYNLLYKSNYKWCFRNAKKLTQQEVIDLLFNNGGN